MGTSQTALSKAGITFYSETLEAYVRCCYEHDADVKPASIEVTEVWVGLAFVGPHLRSESLEAISREAEAAVKEEENFDRIATKPNKAFDSLFSKTEHKAMFRRAMHQHHAAQQPVYLEPPRVEPGPDQFKCADEMTAVQA